MDRTELAVRRTLAAVDAPFYDIGILTDRGMFPRMDALTAAQCIAGLRYLKYRNANGAHIYFRPSGERRFTLLDDLSLSTIASLKAQSFEACAVVGTSPGNFQAWLKHSRILPRSSARLPLSVLRSGSVPTPAPPTGDDSDGFPASPTGNSNTGPKQGCTPSPGCTVAPASSSGPVNALILRQVGCIRRRPLNELYSARAFGHGSAEHVTSPCHAFEQPRSTRADLPPQIWHFPSRRLRTDGRRARSRTLSPPNTSPAIQAGPGVGPTSVEQPPRPCFGSGPDEASRLSAAPCGAGEPASLSPHPSSRHLPALARRLRGRVEFLLLHLCQVTRRELGVF